MSLISEEDSNFLRQMFQKELDKSVRIIVLVKNEECKYCRETVQIAREVASLDPRIGAEVLNIDENGEKIASFPHELIPATIIAGEEDYGIRFYGIPSGHEFSTYVQDLVNVSKRNPNLSKKTLRSLETIDTGVHIRVFVTPTCPYCPKMVLMAHQFAMASNKIKADMIEVLEFPQMAKKYNVLGVPRTVINERHTVAGLLPEQLFLEFVLYSIGKVEKISPRLETVLRATELESIEYSEHQH